MPSLRSYSAIVRRAAEVAMSKIDKGPISMPLLGATAAIVCAALLVYQHFAALTLGSLCRTWLLLPLVLG